MWVHLILILKKSKLWNNHEQIKVQMKFKNIYIHEGRFFVCFVPIVYETKVIMTQGKLLNLKIRIHRKINWWIVVEAHKLSTWKACT
jgi:hypothetical protein